MTLRTVTFDDADWQVVPKNPVPEMIESGARETIAPLATARAVYTAMLAAAPEPPAQQPTINVVFRCEDNDVVGTTSHQPIHSVRQEDDGSFTVALDYWPTPTRLPAQPRRPYGTDTMSEYGVIPECDGPKPPAHEELEAVRQGWIRVVDEFLVTRHLGIASPTDTYDEARTKLLKIIDFEIDIATDPVVGGDRVRKGESNEG